MTADFLSGLEGAFALMLLTVLIVGAAAAIGLEHLVIYLWHHLHIAWS
jgi:hypothetical protein